MLVPTPAGVMVMPVLMPASAGVVVMPVIVLVFTAVLVLMRMFMLAAVFVRVFLFPFVHLHTLRNIQ